jgi:molybdopterin converting factor small subunit
MNKTQTTTLMEAHGELENAVETLRNLVQELQDDFEEKSEKWQESDKGEAAQQVITDIGSAADEAEGAVNTLQEYVNG